MTYFSKYDYGSATVRPMLRLALLSIVLLLGAGCATRPSARANSFSVRNEAAQDNDFFYGHIWKAQPSPDEAEDRAFFYHR